MKPTPSDEIMNTLAGGAPEVALAKGVLIQAKQDLRRFRRAQDLVGREMYRDAYGWVASDNFAWPYSFLNVCKALRLHPDVLRKALLADAQPGWYTRSRRLAQKLSSPLRGSLAGVFLSRSKVANAH
jgi:hypothetical protein